MGLFSFVKDAGEKLFGKDDDEGREALAEVLEKKKAKQLERTIEGHGFGVTNLAVTIDDDTATIAGTAASMEDREKIVLIVGNTDGIAHVDDQLQVAAVAAASAGGETVTQTAPGTAAETATTDAPITASGATLYTVEKGDTLSAISKRHYGKSSLYTKIFEANKPMLKDPDRIYPGQVLRIPPQD